MKKNVIFVLVFAAIASSWFLTRHPARVTTKPPVESFTLPPKKDLAALSKKVQSVQSFSKLKSQWNDFTDTEKSDFYVNLTNRYKPALKKWCDAFSGRVPFPPDVVTTNNFVERIGTRPTYREYIFVMDGITLGIQDSQGIARVDYLNVPKETRQLNILPSGQEVPISTPPVSKQEVVKILAAEGGTQFKPNEVRLIPSGYSGALNGGAIVNVGGDPDNAASWKYDMVFDAEGKLAYYLKGR